MRIVKKGKASARKPTGRYVGRCGECNSRLSADAGELRGPSSSFATGPLAYANCPVCRSLVQFEKWWGLPRFLLVLVGAVAVIPALVKLVLK